MLASLRAELLTQRHSGLAWFALAGGFIPAIANALYPTAFEWSRFAMSATLYLNLSSFLLVPGLAGYLVSREYEQLTMSVLCAAPIPRTRTLLAKYVGILPSILAMYLVAVAITMVSGMARSGFLPSDAGFWGRYLSTTFGLLVVHYCLAPAALLAGILGRRTVAPILLGFAYVLMYKLFTYGEFGSLVPPCIPTFYLFWRYGVQPEGIVASFRPLASAVLLAAWLVGFLACAVVAFLRQEGGEK